MQIEIAFTFPPDEEAGRASEDLARLDQRRGDADIYRAAIEAAETVEQRAEMEQALAEAEGEQARRPALAEQAARRRELRFIVRARAYLDRGHYSRILQEGREWFEAQTGRPLEGDSLGDEELELVDLVFCRANVLSSIDRERTPEGYRYKAEGRTAPDGEWQPESIPPEWTTLEGMGGAMPLALLTAWNNAARELNRGAGDFFGQGAIRVTRSA